MNILLSSSDGVLADLCVRSLLRATHSHSALLEWGKATAERAVLLLSKVVGHVPLLLECISGGIDALLAQDGHSLGNVLPNLPDRGQLDLRLRGHLGHAKLSESFLFYGRQRSELVGRSLTSREVVASRSGGLTRCMVSSSTSLASSYFLSVWALTLFILLNLFNNNISVKTIL